MACAIASPDPRRASASAGRASGLRIVISQVDGAKVCRDSRPVDRSNRVFVAGFFIVIAVAAASGCNLAFRSEPAGSSDAVKDGAFTGDALPLDAACGADDVDCDGVADIVDNCVDSKNPEQLNQDADKFGDVCDNCVGVGNSQGANRDNDHLGDDCDPDVSMQSIYARYFVEGGTVLGVLSLPSDWATTTSADVRYLRNMTAAGESRYTLANLVQQPVVIIEAGVKDLGEDDKLSKDNDFGVFIGSTRLRKNIDCMNVRNAATGEAARVFVNSSNTLSTGTGPRVAGPRRITLFLSDAGNSTVNVLCRVDDFLDITFIENFDLSDVEVGLVGRGRAGTAAYVVVAN